MLSYELLRNHAGILLVGDHETLWWVYETVHAVNEASPLVRDKEGYLIGLAFDVRKAFMGERRVLPALKDRKEIGARFGVEILWPVLLLQQRVLRASLAYFTHTKRDQAVCWTLEAVIEQAIADDFGTMAPAIVQRWERLDGFVVHALERIHGRGAVFCSWRKTERRQRLAILLESLDPMYDFTYEQRVRQGERDLVDPAECGRWEGMRWPDVRW